LGEFERIHGDRQQMRFADSADPQHNYMWHAARAFFENGGKRLYVQRVFESDGGDPEASCATVTAGSSVMIRSRFPGRSGGRRVRIALDIGVNVLAPDPSSPSQPAHVFRGLKPYDVVWISQQPASPPPVRTGSLYLATAAESAGGIRWTFKDRQGNEPQPFWVPGDAPATADEVRVVTATVTVYDGNDRVCRVIESATVDPASVTCVSALTGQTASQNVDHHYGYDAEGNPLQRPLCLLTTTTTK
jgi:hypothetical protein